MTDRFRNILCVLAALLIGMQGTVCCCSGAPLASSKPAAIQTSSSHSCCESMNQAKEHSSMPTPDDGHKDSCEHGKCHLASAKIDTNALAGAFAAGPQVFVLSAPACGALDTPVYQPVNLPRTGPPPVIDHTLFSLSILLTI
ncbi:hypothetical protein HED60_23290 [Planctomycetales bacterium ZRK34]|nr:hypothetical protein HED60_23290 [Planctomycetales bacterium ZRK34]